MEIGLGLMLGFASESLLNRYSAL